MLPPLHSLSDSVSVEMECGKEDKNILFFKKSSSRDGDTTTIRPALRVMEMENWTCPHNWSLKNYQLVGLVEQLSRSV